MSADAAPDGAASAAPKAPAPLAERVDRQAYPEADFAKALAGGASSFGLGADFAVLAAGLAVLTWIGGWMYPRLIT